MSSADRQAPSTFVFADLAGWTALTEAHGDVEALRIVTEFADRVGGLLHDHRAEQIKTIGDAVMIRVADPSDAVELGLDIAERLSAAGSPPVRVGMHSGPALPRDGDWFGATVNLASRVAAAARPGEVLLTESTRQVVRQPNGFELRPGGERELRHIADPVRVYRAVDPRRPDVVLEIDPVCRMAVDPVRAPLTRHRMGVTYYFCSPECAAAFAVRPRRYVATGPAARTARTGFLINLGAFLVLGGAHLIAWIGGGHAAGVPPLLFVYVAWAIVLLVHFRAVRRLL